MGTVGGLRDGKLKISYSEEILTLITYISAQENGKTSV